MRRVTVSLAALSVAVWIAGCANDVRQQVTSPDGKFTATCYQVNPGAMDSGVTVVAIHPRGERVSRFHPDVFATNGLRKVTLRWTREALDVECPTCERDRIEVMRSEFRGYRVTYPRLATEQ